MAVSEVSHRRPRFHGQSRESPLDRPADQPQGSPTLSEEQADGVVGEHAIQPVRMTTDLIVAQTGRDATTTIDGFGDHIRIWSVPGRGQLRFSCLEPTGLG